MPATLDLSRKYFEKTLSDFRKELDKGYSEATEEKVAHDYIQRMLGVSFFVQTCGVPFDVINPVYNEYKEKIKTTLREKYKV